MRKIKFLKYQGCGNDFIVIDNRHRSANQISQEQVRNLCDRKFGIGADGLMLLQEHPELDFEMIYYNSDGGLGSMCGNGGRCMVAFAKHIELITDSTTFIASDGVHEASIQGNWVSLKMNDVSTIEQVGNDFRLNTGSPHYVKQVVDLANLDVPAEGSAIRNNAEHRVDGINVNFVSPEEEEGYFVRTFERGVEDETLACGTGVTAVALAMASKGGQAGVFNTPIRVPGGKLNVRFHYDGNIFTQIYLEGPATLVFEGAIEIS